MWQESEKLHIICVLAIVALFLQDMGNMERNLSACFLVSDLEFRAEDSARSNFQQAIYYATLWYITVVYLTFLPVGFYWLLIVTVPVAGDFQ